MFAFFCGFAAGAFVLGLYVNVQCRELIGALHRLERVDAELGDRLDNVAAILTTIVEDDDR